MTRSGRTAVFADLRRAFRLARERNLIEAPASAPRVSRRGFLKASMAAVMSAYAGGVEFAMAANKSASIAVVGAGIAGLNATYVLKNAGITATLYEASGHIGGRIQTNHNGLAPNLYTELGGEFIDSVHKDMLALARKFGLSLIDTQAKSEKGLQVAYYAGGRLRTEDEVIAAFQPLAAIVDNDARRLSNEITYDSHSAFDVRVDRTPLRDYLTQNVTVDWLYNILEAAYVNEFGLNLEDQSSLNFIETIGTDTSHGFQIYGISDQRYKVLGGNQQIVSALASQVASQIHLGNRLEALDQSAGGEYILTFQSGAGGVGEVRADFVLLCLPFTILREVDLRVPLPAIKQRAIRELGYGANAKLILGFQNRLWRDQGFDGDSYADLDYQSGWDSSRQQPTLLGAYTIYPGGTLALELGPGTALTQAKRLLPELDQVFPGLRRKWSGTALRAFWPDNPFVKASYASYLPGQWTGIRGAEGEAVGNLYFAGEHTSLDWQGYMNGGAESGRLAAKALIQRLR